MINLDKDTKFYKGLQDMGSIIFLNADKKYLLSYLNNEYRTSNVEVSIPKSSLFSILFSRIYTFICKKS